MTPDQDTEQIIAAIQDARDRGEPVDPDDLKRRFPSHAGQIEGLLLVEDEIRGTSPEPDEGTRIGPYRLGREIGRGGMGRVFEAHHEPLKRTVALKLLSGLDIASEAVVRRFHREAEATARLSHPGIVGIHDHGVDRARNVAYIAMERIEGRSLAAILEDLTSLRTSEVTGRQLMETAGVTTGAPEGGGRTVEIFCRWTVDLARALHAAHEAGVIHRDVKPGNVLIRPTGQPVLTDFGLALLEDLPGLTRSQDFLGTPAYMSPEQLTRHGDTLDRRTDVYSLGVLLYECLTLRRPHQGATSHELARHIAEEEPPRPTRLARGIHHDLETIVLKTLEKDPDRRYATAGELADDLERFLRHEPIAARPAGLPTRTLRFARRHRPWVVAAGAVVIVVGSLLIWNQLQVSRTCADKTEGALSTLGELRSEIEALTTGLGTMGGELPDLAGDVSARLGEAHAAAREIALLRPAHPGATRIALGLFETGKSLASLHAGLVETVRREEETLSDLQLRYATGSSGGMPGPPPIDLERRLTLLRSLQASSYLQTLSALQMAQGVVTRAPALFTVEDLSRTRARVDLPAHEALRRAGDVEGARALAATIRELDPELEAVLQPRGSLSVTSDPSGASVYVYRYESLSNLLASDEDRVVPVAYDWNGEDERRLDANDTAGVEPGSICLCVETVDEAGTGHRAGLRPGDLITALDGRPIGESTYGWIEWSEEPRPVEVASFDRLISIEGKAVNSPAHVIKLLLQLAPGSQDRVSVEVEKPDGTRIVTAPLDPAWIRSLGEEEFLLRGPAEERKDLRLTVVRDGSATEAVLQGGKPHGLRLWTTSCPLVTCEPTCIGKTLLPSRSLPVGSYLLLLRREGYEDLRYPVVLEAERDAGSVDLRLSLNPLGTTPPGMVYIPPFVARIGGDPGAIASRKSYIVSVGPFFVGRDEVSLGEYAPIINDPVAERIVQGFPGSGWHHTWGLLPKKADGYAFAEDPPDPAQVERVTLYITPDGRLKRGHPPWHGVNAITLVDCGIYCQWLTALQPGGVGASRTYRLPTSQEWEAVARGADGRLFPWGDTFDWRFFTGWHSFPIRRDKASLIRPIDESPFGVRGLAGGIAVEWCHRDKHEDSHLHGGSFQWSLPAHFHAASRIFQGPNQIYQQTAGMRVCLEVE